MPSITAADPVIPARKVVRAGDDPVTVTATVVSVERRDEPGIFGPMIGLDAQLEIVLPGRAEPHTYFLSRLVGEHRWMQDAYFGGNGYPGFSHGFGSRCVQKQGVVLEVEALLDEAARIRALATEIGPGIPLTLADAPADAGGQA
ncbi:hypothetical protein [Amycolatopsis magusensis]|uniref:hypothetical protein n=1 Tax=Amycolatopsis magusensis TaxID=882444 RepID=UPI0037A70A41